MRWVKISNTLYLNLALASNVEVGDEADYSAPRQPGEPLPKRRVLRVYFPREHRTARQPASVPVYGVEAQATILGMLEVMSNDSLKSYSARPQPRAGIKRTGEPIEVNPVETDYDGAPRSGSIRV